MRLLRGGNAERAVIVWGRMVTCVGQNGDTVSARPWVSCERLQAAERPHPSGKPSER